MVRKWPQCALDGRDARIWGSSRAGAADGAGRAGLAGGPRGPRVGVGFAAAAGVGGAALPVRPIFLSPCIAVDSPVYPAHPVYPSGPAHPPGPAAALFSLAPWA